MTNTASKDILARLLATENITVQHANVSTASFHVRDRILTLPVWEDMQEYTYDHLVGHEVGHALFTPEEGWHDAVVDGGRVFRSFLNVVEDARIEKLIQRRYPGLRRSFIRSYKKMLNEGFFGVSMDSINSMNLIDRINTYFKCGPSVGVEFADNEFPWLQRIENAETWEDVETISRELLAFCKEEFEKKKQQEEEQESGDSSEEDAEEQGHTPVDSDEEEDAFDLTDAECQEYDETDEGDGSDADEFEGETDEGDGSDADEFEGTGETDSEGAAIAEEGSTGGNGEVDPDFEESETSHTEEQLHENIEQQLSTSAFEHVFNFNTSSVDGNRFVKDYKDTISKIRSASFDEEVFSRIYKMRVPQDTYMDDFYQKFHSQNSRIVDYMVKEFQMKKRAQEYARSSTSKTGVIDTVKMNNYLFEDDIFRKITVVPEGKSHGILIYLDWSGSMHGNVFAAVQQMCLVSMFCRKADIPFRVFIFTNETSGPQNTAVDELFSDFTLREVFSSSMKKSEFRYVVGAMLAYGHEFDQTHRYSGLRIAVGMHLCGTPLDAAIMYASDVHRDFQKKYRLDKTSTFFITDGASHPVRVNSSNPAYGKVNLIASPGSLIRITDTQTKKQYRLSGYNRATNTFLQMYKERTGSSTIGYFITKQSGKRVYEKTVSIFNRGVLAQEKLSEFFRVNKFAPAPHPAYDQFFVISAKQMRVGDTEMEVDDGATKSKIRNAFKKSQGNKKSIRTMSSQLMDMIA